MILPDLIEHHATSRPDHPAFYFKDRVITYGELQSDILKCAQGLSVLGIKKGTTFGVVLRNSPEFVVLAMALSRLGGVLVPINFLEKPDRIALILNDAKAVGVLTASEFLRNVVQAKKKIKTLKHLYIREGSHPQAKSFSDLLKNGSASPPSRTKESDIMMLLYTSGTTGLPKGVMLTHKNFLSNVQQCLDAIPLKSKDIFMCLLPMFHSFAWTTCVLIPLKLGTSIVIIESLLPFDPVIKAIWKFKVTLFVAVPQIYSALAGKIKGPKALLLRFLNPVRLCISGAAPLPGPVHKNFENNVGVKLLEGYGLTEASPVVSFNPVDQQKPGTVGKPLPGIEVEIRDDQKNKLPMGEVGEIWVRGDNVMKGYYKKPGETKKILTKDHWLITGDMGQLDSDGFLKIVDRKKDLIIVKGLNVYPQEIETLIATLPFIKEVAVVGKMDENTGEERIRAFVSPKEGHSIDKDQIMDLCRKELSSYKRPKDIIVMDDLPKNALQKILKKDLRQL